MPKISSETYAIRRLRFRDLQVFLAVVQHGSMGKAAAQLGVTQPSVSELISGLESTIGARLFDRNPEGVQPTIYGQALLKRAIASFDELRLGLRDLEYIADPTVGEIRIGCPDSIAATTLSQMIADFCRDYPRISLRFDQVPAPTLEVPMLHARKLDMVIAWLSAPKYKFGADLSVETLFEDEVVVAAGRNSHWARKRKISLSDLAKGPWTGAPPETMARIVLDEAFQGANLPTPQMEVTTFSIPLRHHLLTTAGFLTALPKSLVHCSPDLKELAIALPRHNYPVAIVTVKNRILNPAADLFLERVRRFIRSGSKESLLSAVP
jgi:DNA-binding transcriptional LysR family regulator